jgi:transcriptional regulator with XRE-family HTH domain
MFESIRKSDNYKISKITLDFANKLWELMQQKNIKPSQLAKSINTSPAYITKVLRGDANYTVETLYKLTKAVGCELDIKIKDEKKKWQEHQGLSLVTMDVTRKTEMGKAVNASVWTDSPIKVA